MLSRTLGLSFLSALSAVVVLSACSGGDATIADNDSGAGGNDGGVGGQDGAGGGSDGSSGGSDGASSGNDGGRGSDAGSSSSLRTVFLIMMENHSWADIKGSASAPYINGLLATGAHAEQYFTPTGIHPSEPNYLWLEAGSNFGITNDNAPAQNHQATTEHLVTQLKTANIPWKAYAEDVVADTCPTTDTGLYAAKHMPQVFFDDVTGDPAYCKAHIRPFTELAADLSGANAARYNFITPSLCNDMHGTTGGFQCVPGVTDLIKMGDDWLKTNVAKITASQAYQNGGVVFILWDEGSGAFTGSDGPLGLIALSSKVKPGFASSTKFTHSSMLKTVSMIFGVTPLRDANAAATKDLGELFTSFP